MTKLISSDLIGVNKWKGKSLSVDELNEIFTPLTFENRIKKLYEYFPVKEVLYTSSFGTKSVFLLHLISQINRKQVVHFIDTTYHFQETLDYKNRLQKLFKINVIDVLPDPLQNGLTTEESWWIEHPKMCCTINKVVALDPIVAQHEVWISGLMSNQTEFRNRLRVFEKQGDILKFHPIVDIDEGEFLFHIGKHQLPEHPLKSKGYGSVGCTHCTVKGEGRSGRWQGTAKTECGLHPNYFNKKK